MFRRSFRLVYSGVLAVVTFVSLAGLGDDLSEWKRWLTMFVELAFPNTMRILLAAAAIAAIVALNTPAGVWRRGGPALQWLLGRFRGQTVLGLLRTWAIWRFASLWLQLVDYEWESDPTPSRTPQTGTFGETVYAHDQLYATLRVTVTLVVTRQMQVARAELDFGLNRTRIRARGFEPMVLDKGRWSQDFRFDVPRQWSTTDSPVQLYVLARGRWYRNLQFEVISIA